MPRFVDLVVIEGTDRGMRYSVASGSYRVLGRAGDAGVSTVHMTRDGDRLLDDEQKAVVERVGGQGDGAPPVRRRDADILVHDSSVSRSHAAVFVSDETVRVADLHSTNGTKVNGQPVHEREVQAGDVVQVGNTKLALEDG